MIYLEHRKIVHGYVHPCNIFCRVVDGQLMTKLGGFGMSHSNATSVLSTVEQNRRDVRWLAPEILSGQTTTPQSDVWSFGITVWVTFPRNFCEDYMNFTMKSLYFVLVN